MKDGYYKKIVYSHNPDNENKLFRAALKDYLKGKEKITGIEIGVLNGDTSRTLLHIDNRINLIGIDPLIPDSMEITLIGDRKKIKENTKGYKKRWTFIENYSYKVHKRFKNKSIDFIFIDGSHIYEDVKKDYKLYYPKIKKGGLIFIHDSRMNRGGANFHIGSSKFTDEIILKKAKLIGEAFSLTCFKK